MRPVTGCGAHQRMAGARRLAWVGHRLEALPQLAGAVVGGVVGADPALDRGLQIVGQGLVGAVEIAEAGLAARGGTSTAYSTLPIGGSSR